MLTITIVTSLTPLNIVYIFSVVFTLHVFVLLSTWDIDPKSFARASHKVCKFSRLMLSTYFEIMCESLS